MAEAGGYDRHRSQEATNPMLPARLLDWLGFRRGRSAIGVSLTDEVLTVVVVRTSPLRLVALGREVVDPTRAGEAVAAGLRRCLEAFAVDWAQPAVVIVEPSVMSLDLGATTTGPVAPCPVDRRVLDRAVALLAEAGLRNVQADPAPAALLRLVELVAPGAAGIVATGRWLVARDTDRRWAEAVSGDAPGPAAGADRLGSLTDAVGRELRPPRRAKRLLELDRDGLAIGAALAGLGVEPRVEIRVDEAPSVAEGRNRPSSAQWPPPDPGRSRGQG